MKEAIKRFRSRIVLATAVAVAAAGAADITWKTDAEGRVNDWNWAEPDNFVGEVAPGVGDIVIIPDNLTVQMKSSDVASTNVLAGLACIYPTTSSSRIIFTAENAADLLAVPCGVHCRGNSGTLVQSRIGEIVKEGPGEVRLLSNSASPDYNTRITINAGALRLPYAPKLGRMYYGRAHIAREGVLFTGTADSIGYNYTQPFGITGEGTITNDSPITNWLRLRGDEEESVFSGIICGNVKVSNESRWMLTGEQSTMSANPMPYSIDKELGTAGFKGILGVKKFGEPGQPSSLGTATEIFGGSDWTGNGGGYIYLGEGERTTKKPWASLGLLWLDGGAHGNLEFAGQFYWGEYMPHFVLTGSNTVPCRISGMITPAKGVQPYFTKKGTGAWRFVSAANSIGNRNAALNFTVEEGSLQFDSLRPANEVCALGLATNKVCCHVVPAAERNDAADRTDYTFVLGGTNSLGEASTEGTLEPVAGTLGGLTNGFWTTDRPIALKGHGRLLMNAIDNGAGVERRLTMRGVRALTAGEHVLTLDGTGVNDNTIADIVDGPVGKVSVVKKGTGKWVLSGTNSFSGELSVEAGTLVVNSSRNYSWYRLAIKRLNGGGQAQVKKLSLFDADGIDQTVGITLESQWDHSILRRGRIADGRSSIHTWGANSYLANLFTTSSDFTTIMRFKMYGNGTDTWRPQDQSNGAPVPANPATWYWFDFRLPEGSNPVESYDMIAPFDNIAPSVVQGTNNDNKFMNSIRAWQLLGSVDGVHWDVLHEIDDAANMSADMHYAEAGKTNYWMSAQYAYVRGEGPHTGGQPIAVSIAEPFDQLTQAKVSVAVGATLAVEGPALTINSFKASANGIGTLRNVVFAETGKLEVADVDPNLPVSIAGTYEDVSGLENLGKWKVSGAPYRCSAVVREGKIVLCRHGTMVLFR
ncbi:MAG: autotransporter-associated beta strand repeat-containing protein [Kiritimatiellae bacterium]|nr:autotransporter-associated beta strand repeat-containing protein [Kiritimatiellia bacterium]